MCEPVSWVMAITAAVGASQQNQAKNAAARAQNTAFAENQALQTDAYNADMANYWEQDIQAQKEAWQTAEDAADAKLDMVIAKAEKVSAWDIASLGGGGGGSADRGLAVLKRQAANEMYDIDLRFQRGLMNISDQRKFAQYDKIGRYHQAKGAIASVRRNPGLTEGSMALNIVGSGVSGYVSGMGKGPDPAKTPTTPHYGMPPTLTRGGGVQ